MPGRKQIQAEIQAACGGANLISFGRLAKYLGIAPHTARELLAEVPSYEIGRKKCYFASDVARWLEDRRRI